MLLIGVPSLTLGRPGLRQWQQRASTGLLRGLTVWGGFMACILVLMWLGDQQALQLGNFAQLLFALSILGWFAAWFELARRQRSGETGAVRAEGTSRRSGNPARPLSFMQELEAKQAVLRAGTALRPPASVEPAAPLTPVATPVLDNQPPVSRFAPPAPPAAPVSAAAVATVRPATEGAAQRRATRSARARLVEVLQAYHADAASAPAMGTAAAVSAAAPASDWLSGAGVQSAFNATPAPLVVSFTVPAPVPSSPAPMEPAPSGPVTLGAGFSYKPQLVESRLGQGSPAPPPMGQG
jgi:hypothetical protein